MGKNRTWKITWGMIDIHDHSSQLFTWTMYAQALETIVRFCLIELKTYSSKLLKWDKCDIINMLKWLLKGIFGSL